MVNQISFTSFSSGNPIRVSLHLYVKYKNTNVTIDELSLFRKSKLYSYLTRSSPSEFQTVQSSKLPPEIPISTWPTLASFDLQFPQKHSSWACLSHPESIVISNQRIKTRWCKSHLTIETVNLYRRQFKNKIIIETFMFQEFICFLKRKNMTPPPPHTRSNFHNI